MNGTAGQWRALIEYYERHRRPVAVRHAVHGLRGQQDRAHYATPTDGLFLLRHRQKGFVFHHPHPYSAAKKAWYGNGNVTDYRQERAQILRTLMRSVKAKLRHSQFHALIGCYGQHRQWRALIRAVLADTAGGLSDAALPTPCCKQKHHGKYSAEHRCLPYWKVH